MITNFVKVNRVDSPKEAPTYDVDVTIVKITNCIVVGRGTVAENPTVDLQLEDKEGKKFLIMTTGAIMESIAAVVKGQRLRDQGTAPSRETH